MVLSVVMFCGQVNLSGSTSKVGEGGTTVLGVCVFVWGSDFWCLESGSLLTHSPMVILVIVALRVASGLQWGLPGLL